MKRYYDHSDDNTEMAWFEVKELERAVYWISFRNFAVGFFCGMAFCYGLKLLGF